MTLPRVLNDFEVIRSKYGFCQNRIWQIIKTAMNHYPMFWAEILGGIASEKIGRHEGHDLCSYDYCEHSRLDFTKVAQRHICSDGKCDTQQFNTSKLERAIDQGKLTAWALNCDNLIEKPSSFMAISHVWSDGTGSGMWPPGTVNKCLFNFFKNIAEQFQCDGIWWDTICIPTGKSARSKAIATMYRNYEDARITLVHDCFLQNWEWVNEEAACIAVVISPWFSRGWTALELAKSYNVKIIFKNGVIKDLDRDILAVPNPSPNHKILSEMIQNLRRGKIDSIGSLLRVLGSRSTSWPRDIAIISAQLAGIAIEPGLSQQAIYQKVLTKIGRIERESLFHNSATMAKGFAWCPTDLFHMPYSSTPSDGSILDVMKDGTIRGKWRVLQVELYKNLAENCIWEKVHPLKKSELRCSLTIPGHLLLVDPLDDTVSKGLLVKLCGDDIESRDGDDSKIFVTFVGSPHFHPALEITMFKEPEMVSIGPKSGGLHVQEPGKLRPTNKPSEDADKNTPLHLAAQSGNLDELDRWIWEISPGIGNIVGMTPMHLAARNGHHNFVKRLAHHHEVANFDQPDNCGWTPLHYAVWHCQREIVQEMLFHRNFNPETVNMRDRLGQTVLHLAAERGKEDIVILIMKAPRLINHRTDNGQDAFHRAVLGGSLEILSSFLTCWGLSLDADNNGQTPLHLAAQMGDLDIAAKLAPYYDLTIRDKNFLTPLELAAKNGHGKVVEKLLEGRHNATTAQPNDWDLVVRSALFRAVEMGNVNIVKILNSKVPIDFEDRHGCTRFRLAARYGHEAILDELLKLKPALNCSLIEAARMGHYGVVKTLVQHRGINREETDSRGWTALSWAAHSGHIHVVEELASHCKLRHKDKDGLIPLELAYKSEAKNRLQVASLLIECDRNLHNINTDMANELLLFAAENGKFETIKKLRGYKLECQSRNLTRLLECMGEGGRTLLSLAVLGGHNSTADYLLAEGANAHTEDNQKNTPIKLAFKTNNDEAVLLLLRHRKELISQLTAEETDRVLRKALQKRDSDVFDLLLETNSNIKFNNDASGLPTPLEYAAKWGEPSVLKKLLKKGAELHRHNRILEAALTADDGRGLLFLMNHQQPLQLPSNTGSKIRILNFAIQKGPLELVERIFQDPDIKNTQIKDWKEWTPLFWAVAAEKTESVKRLLELGANPNDKDLYGRTPLFYTDNTSIMEELIRKKALVFIRDHANNSLASRILEMKGKPEVTEILKLCVRSCDPARLINGREWDIFMAMSRYAGLLNPKRD